MSRSGEAVEAIFPGLDPDLADSKVEIRRDEGSIFVKVTRDV